MSGLVYVNSWEGPWTGPEFLGGPTKGQYYNKRNILTPVNTEVAPVVTSSSYNLNPNASLKDQYLNRLAALQSSSLSSSSYQNFKNLLQSKLEGKAEGGRIGYQTGGPTNRFLKYMIDMLVKEKDFNRGLLERSKPELVEGLFKQTYGKSAEEIANAVNQQLKGKSSMEVMNPKTGEIISPTEPIKTGRTTADIEKEIDELSTTPITTLEKKRKYNDLHSEFINSLDPRGRNKNLDYRRKSLDLENRLLLKAEEKGLDFDTFEKLRQDLYGSKKQQTLDFMRTGKVNLEPIKPATTFEEVQNRHKIAAKAADEVFPNYNDPKTAAQELAEVMAEQKYKKSFGDLTGDKQSDLYSEAYKL